LSVLPPPPNQEKALAIYRVILEVEATKQITPPLTDQQREVLMRLLNDTGLPVAEIAKIGRKVIEKTTYGNIAWEHWRVEIEARPKDRMPAREPDRFCLDCDKNHKWDELCPIVEAEVKALPKGR
jgi:hypothetical protein